MMNFPGALHGEPEVMKKIAAALERGKPVDGHAPGLRGEEARKYIDRGISTDHECFTIEEALDKLSYGMKILIREGSAAKNFEALIDLLHDHPDKIMFCSDDKHPDSLVEGHINQLCARAIAKGINLFKVLRAACINPAVHYKLEVGLLREGDPADFILTNELTDFTVKETWINGMKVAENGVSLIQITNQQSGKTETVNQFDCSKKEQTEFAVPAGIETFYPLPIIEAYDGQLITGKFSGQPLRENGCWVSDPSSDILKIVVVNRYSNAPVARAFTRNFGLKQGAMASSVAHDSHNIVAVGVDDESLSRAVNLVIAHKGGVSCVKDNLEMILPLPVAGLMSAEDGYKVAELYTLIDRAAKDAGSTLSAPFMTLSFMALLVIPHLKISDKGLFDADTFQLL
jgi:adenine deaminase